MPDEMTEIVQTEKGKKQLWVVAHSARAGLGVGSCEAVSEARRVADRARLEVCVLLITDSEGTEPGSVDAGRYGADSVYRAVCTTKQCLDLQFQKELVARTIATFSPAIVIFSATSWGAEVAPRVSVRLGCPCYCAVKKIAIRRSKVQLTRAVHRDALYQASECTLGDTLVITLNEGDFDAQTVDRDAPPTVVDCDSVEIVDTPRPPEKTAFIKADHKTVDLCNAERIVAIGRGLNKSLLSDVAEVADRLSAAVGGSRVAVDIGHVPYVRQIGLTGRTVSPNLLITFGISGAQQFVAGMDRSQLVIAVNNDPQAPIFQHADLCIKADAGEVLEALLADLKN